MNDEHHGMGGSYVVDLKTGKRTLVERTAEAVPVPAETPEAVSAPAEKTAKKEG